MLELRLKYPLDKISLDKEILDVSLSILDYLSSHPSYSYELLDNISFKPERSTIIKLEQIKIALEILQNNHLLEKQADYRYALANNPE